MEDLKANAKLMLGEKKTKKLKQGAKFNTEWLELATRLVAAGMTEQDVAYFLGTTPRQVKGWKRRDPMFKKACEQGKELGLSYLIAQGLRAAAGYEYEEKNIKIKRKYVSVENENGERVDELVSYPAEESTFVKVQPPNPQLLMFLVTNISRQLGKAEEQRWMSQHKIEIDDQKNISIKISGEVATEQIERLAGAFMPKKLIDVKVTDANTAQDSRKPRRSTKSNPKTHRK